MGQVDIVKDLGVLVDKCLMFDHHINNIVARASIRANLIHKCFLSKDITIMTRALVTYVRPLLEHALSILNVLNQSRNGLQSGCLAYLIWVI